MPWSFPGKGYKIDFDRIELGESWGDNENKMLFPEDWKDFVEYARHTFNTGADLVLSNSKPFSNRNVLITACLCFSLVGEGRDIIFRVDNHLGNFTRDLLYLCSLSFSRVYLFKPSAHTNQADAILYVVCKSSHSQLRDASEKYLEPVLGVKNPGGFFENAIPKNFNDWYDGQKKWVLVQQKIGANSILKKLEKDDNSSVSRHKIDEAGSAIKSVNYSSIDNASRIDARRVLLAWNMHI
jgi:hypothetical protein